MFRGLWRCMDSLVGLKKLRVNCTPPSGAACVAEVLWIRYKKKNWTTGVGFNKAALRLFKVRVKDQKKKKPQTQPVVIPFHVIAETPETSRDTSHEAASSQQHMDFFRRTHFSAEDVRDLLALTSRTSVTRRSLPGQGMPCSFDSGVAATVEFDRTFGKWPCEIRDDKVAALKDRVDEYFHEGKLRDGPRGRGSGTWKTQRDGIFGLWRLVRYRKANMLFTKLQFAEDCVEQAKHEADTAVLEVPSSRPNSPVDDADIWIDGGSTVADRRQTQSPLLGLDALVSVAAEQTRKKMKRV
jgi:hypothetical protein